MTTLDVHPIPSFRELRHLADTSPVIRTCIELRKQELAATGWDITPAGRDSYEATPDFAGRRLETVRFFRQPDPGFASFYSWMGALAEQVLVLNTCPVYLSYPGSQPGLLGSTVSGLSLLDAERLVPSPPRVFPAGPLVLSLRYDEGKLDLKATEEAAPEEFGIPLHALGIDGRPEPDKPLRPLDSELRGWFKSLADWVLQEKCGAHDLEWTWDTRDTLAGQ